MSSQVFGWRNAEQVAGAPLEGIAARTASRQSPARLAVVAATLVLLSVVIAAAVAYFAASFTPPVYAARSEIVFQALEGGDVAEQNRATQAVIATGPRVLRPVSERLGIPADTLEENLAVEFPRGGSVMRLQYAGESADGALNTLVAILDEYNAVLSQTEGTVVVTHQLLQPPFVLSAPIRPQPKRAAAIGAAAGLAIGLGGLALVRLWRERW